MSGHEEGYAGPAEVTFGDSSPAVTVKVMLRGLFQPIDGRFHWYGRIADHDGLAGVMPGVSVVLRTPEGSAQGRLSDRDPWGRYRVSGTGRPPFRLNG